MPEISIIVPIYNVKKYLGRCIDSILNQTFKDFELILVNDGSTDGCGIICDIYKQQDKRIKVIHKKNRGLSSARNAGLDIAIGKYIGFVDSDDYIDENMYSELYKVLIKNNSDIAICKFIKVNDYTSINLNNKGLIEENYSNIQALQELYKEKSSEFIVAWNKLYRSSLIKEFRYPVGRKYEDSFIIHRLLYKCNKITYIDKELYYYYQREGSIMNSNFNIDDVDKIDLRLDSIKFFKEINENSLKEKSIGKFLFDYFEIYYKVKYILKDEINAKKIKKIFIRNYNYIQQSRNISIKGKLAMIVFILNEKYYYSKIDTRFN